MAAVAAPAAAAPATQGGGVDSEPVAQARVFTPEDIQRAKDKQLRQQNSKLAFRGAYIMFEQAHPNALPPGLRQGFYDVALDRFQRPQTYPDPENKGSVLEYREGIRGNELQNFLQEKQQNGTDDERRQATQHLAELRFKSTAQRLVEQNPKLLEARIATHMRVIELHRAQKPGDPYFKKADGTPKTEADFRADIQRLLNSQLEIEIPDVTPEEVAALKAEQDAILAKQEEERKLQEQETQRKIAKAAADVGAQNKNLLEQALMSLAIQQGYSEVGLKAEQILSTSTDESEKAAMRDLIIAFSEKELDGLMANPKKNADMIKRLNMRRAALVVERNQGQQYENALTSMANELELKSFFQARGFSDAKVAHELKDPLNALELYIRTCVTDKKVRSKELLPRLKKLHFVKEDVDKLDIMFRDQGRKETAQKIGEVSLETILMFLFSLFQKFSQGRGQQH